MFDRFRRECWLAFRDWWVAVFISVRFSAKVPAPFSEASPLKIVMVFDTRPLNWLFARKEIKSLQDLKGGKADRRLKLRRRTRSNDPRPAA